MKYPISIIAMLLAIVPMTATAQTDPHRPIRPRKSSTRCAPAAMATGVDGGEGHRGGFVPHIGTLANKEYMSQVPDDYLMLIIKKGGAYMGKIATMPAWEKRLSDDEIRRHRRPHSDVLSLEPIPLCHRIGHDGEALRRI